jgi:branched-chain amino acid transport system ATP-binding protein
MTSDDAILSVKSVNAGYGDLVTLRNVSLDVGEGELVALIGPNGAGKTTLFKVICGVVRPDSGRVYFAGRDITGLPPERICGMGIALAPEGRGLFPNMSVRENLLLGARGVRGARINERLNFVYSLFPVLRERLGQRAGSLSGGEQQMLAVGRALMGSPRLLILDEPSSGLAPIVVDRLYESVGKLRGMMSVLIGEQSIKRPMAIADRWYVMEGGRIAMEGTAKRPTDDVKAAYFGVGDDDKGL